MYANCQGLEDTASPYQSQDSLTLIKRKYHLLSWTIHLNALLNFTNKKKIIACSSFFPWSSCELLNSIPGMYRKKKNVSYKGITLVKIIKESFLCFLFVCLFVVSGFFFLYKLISCWSAMFACKDDNVLKGLPQCQHSSKVRVYSANYSKKKKLIHQSQ